MTTHFRYFVLALTTSAASALVLAGPVCMVCGQSSRPIELIAPMNVAENPTSQKDEQSPEEHTDAQRNILLQWLDEELYSHVLFRADDINELRSEIESLSPTALDAYLQQTERLRELMRTDDWLRTNRFFSYYRSLDGVLTPEQQDELAEGAANLPPRTVVRIMRTLMEQYDRLQTAAHASTAQNQATSALRANVIADQDRMREYALQQAASRNGRNYFAPYRTVATVRRDRYHVPGPLITSRGMARLVVYRNLWYGR